MNILLYKQYVLAVVTDRMNEFMYIYDNLGIHENKMIFCRMEVEIIAALHSYDIWDDMD